VLRGLLQWVECFQCLDNFSNLLTLGRLQARYPQQQQQQQQRQQQRQRGAKWLFDVCILAEGAMYMPAKHTHAGCHGHCCRHLSALGLNDGTRTA
jgi:hypothetical protein